MPDVALVRQTVDPDEVDRLREWIEEIRAREDEALASMEAEGMHAEAAFLRETDDGVHLYSFMAADDIEAALAEFTESDRDIDERHREVLEDVIVDGGDLEEFEPLYHLSTDRGE